MGWVVLLMYSMCGWRGSGGGYIKMSRFGGAGEVRGRETATLFNA
jgi:hypothetical protein